MIPIPSEFLDQVAEWWADDGELEELPEAIAGCLVLYIDSDNEIISIGRVVQQGEDLFVEQADEREPFYAAQISDQPPFDGVVRVIWIKSNRN